MCYLGASSLCTVLCREWGPLTDQAGSRPAGQGQGKGVAKAKTAGSKVRLQGPSSRVSCQDSEGVV